jgi:hypothetical protein
MDRVTAAGEENTAAAANNSTVTEKNTGSVTVAGSVLQGAAGINIVNSSDAMVANGVNVYSGTLTTDANNGGANVKQSNDVSQNSAQTARISGYERGTNSQLSVTRPDVTKLLTNASSLNPFNRTANHTETSHDQNSQQRPVAQFSEEELRHRPALPELDPGCVCVGLRERQQVRFGNRCVCVQQRFQCKRCEVRLGDG